jgi:hypothetical protein
MFCLAGLLIPLLGTHPKTKNGNENKIFAYDNLE